LDDGIVSALDINSIVVHWKQIAIDYNLVDSSDENPGYISGLDLNQTIKYWQCVEQKGITACPYLAANDTDGPPTPPNPTASITATSSANDGPPTPPNPNN
jgi:hypothetical protein